MKIAPVAIEDLTSMPFKVILFMMMAFTLSCHHQKSSEIQEKWTGSPIKTEFAKRFRIDAREGYSQLSVFDPWQGAEGIYQKWYLVGRGKALPDSIEKSSVIYVPVKRIICMSTTHAAMISALDENRTICGFSGVRYLYNKQLHDLSGNGAIYEVGYEDNLNKEKIIESEPDLIMVYGVGSESSGYLSKLKELGIKILYNADYLEDDPLGKAEWIKVFGALYSKERQADSIFTSVSSEYLRIKSYVNRNIENRPKVLLGLPFRDTWFISPGNSYISRLVNDAGGYYLWNAINSAVSMPMSLESVFLRALDAEFWLNPGSVKTKDEIEAIEKRLSGLPCFKNGNIYNNNKRINAEGGNDYWESGAVYPNLILKDMASILHPGLFPDNKLYFYRKIK